MPGVSSEERRMLSLDSYMAASFFHNGEILPTFDQTTPFECSSPTPGFEVSNPSFGRENVNFGNERRFVTRSLSFGGNPSFHGDEWPEKDEGLMPLTPAGSMIQNDGICALQKFLPSNNEDEGPIPGADAYACDDFRMYEFKVRRCMRGRSHDWTECPFAHPGEKARRRDPRRFHYSGTACPEFRKGSCRRGDACEFAHGVFECWLHPGRYRTQPCKDGRNCRRRVCFFAHTTEQLRLVPGPAVSSPRAVAGKSNFPAASYDGSPLRQAMSAIFEGGSNVVYDGGVSVSANSSPRGVFKNLSQAQMSSPTSTLVGHSRSPPSMSPPLSPAGDSPPSHFSPWNVKNHEVTGASASLLAAFARRQQQPSVTITLNDGLDYAAAVSCPSPPFSSSAMVDLVGSLQHLDLNNNNNGGVISNGGNSVWMAPYANQISGVSSSSSSSLHGCSPRGSNLRHCSFSSLPCTPTKSAFNDWEFVSDEPVQRVESGRDLRAKIYERLSQENIDSNNSENSPDLGWVNELVK